MTRSWNINYLDTLVTRLGNIAVARSLLCRRKVTEFPRRGPKTEMIQMIPLVNQSVSISDPWVWGIRQGTNHLDLGVECRISKPQLCLNMDSVSTPVW